MHSSPGHLKRVTARFSQAAGTYHDHAHAQRAIARRLLDYLPEAFEPNRILEMGCGTGPFTEQLRARYPASAITAIDVADGMLEHARTRVPDNVTYICSDAATWKPPQPFPLVVSSSALHWCTPLPAVLQNLHTCTAAGGWLVCSVMVDGTLAELRTLRTRLYPNKPVTPLPTSQGVLNGLARAGFKVSASSSEPVETTYPSITDLVKGLRAQGLTGGSFSQGASPLVRTELERLWEAYQEAFSRDNGSVAATFRPLYVQARRPS